MLICMVFLNLIYSIMFIPKRSFLIASTVNPPREHSAMDATTAGAAPQEPLFVAAGGC